MEVTKGQMINGVVRFMKHDVIAKIPDKPFRMALSAIVNLIEVRPEAADMIFESPFLKSESGMYDIDLLEEVVTKTIDEYGDFPITIPAIKFISPTEKELRFTSDDVRKLKSCIIES